MASNSDGTRFRRMMKLPVAALGSGKAPAILLKALGYVANFHTDRRPLATTASLFQLLLPPQHSRFVAFRFGFRDHSLFLIQDGKAGVGENVVGVNF